MKETMIKIEFDKIKAMLSDYASSEKVKQKCLELVIELDEVRCKNAMLETTEARKLLDSLGLPPISNMQGLQGILDHIIDGYCLSEEQLTLIATFLASCSRMKQYLKRSEYLSLALSGYGYSIHACTEIRDEIEGSIRNQKVDDNASPELKKIRNSIDSIKEKVKLKLEQMLRSKSQCFVDPYVSLRNGHYVLPVKKEYKSQIEGTVFDKSSTGNTYYVEPTLVGNLQKELSELEIAEDNEVRRILYTLTAMVYDHINELRGNMSIMCDLDYAFAKGKLSQSMNAIMVPITTDRLMNIINGRHPLLPAATCVPLNFSIGGENKGIIITGPNTGGKTVALKTVGLLSMMAQSGLHVPAMEGSTFCMNNVILCDMGDGQSIEQNLSTFSSHINRIISIFQNINEDSLVLLDELGSGTDPAEGMGIAIAILEELKQVGCLFLTTTHYPEVKDYAKSTKGLLNAKMAFDKESLQPLYRLEIGEAGESCALYIAKRLGFPERMLITAYQATYGNTAKKNVNVVVDISNQLLEDRTQDKLGKDNLIRDYKDYFMEEVDEITSSQDKNATYRESFKYTKQPAINKISKERVNKQVNNHALSFSIGDSVVVYPEKKIGIVCEVTNEQGDILVQIQKRKKLINHKRIKIKAKAVDMYPPDYDFSIIFDSVENRKARKRMTKRHDSNTVIKYTKE